MTQNNYSKVDYSDCCHYPVYRTTTLRCSHCNKPCAIDTGEAETIAGFTTEGAMTPHWCENCDEAGHPSIACLTKNSKSPSTQGWREEFKEIIEPQRKRGWHITDIEQADNLIKNIESFIFQQIEKAREEGYKKGVEDLEAEVSRRLQDKS